MTNSRANADSTPSMSAYSKSTPGLIDSVSMSTPSPGSCSSASFRQKASARPTAQQYEVNTFAVTGRAKLSVYFDLSERRHLLLKSDTQCAALPSNVRHAGPEWQSEAALFRACVYGAFRGRHRDADFRSDGRENKNSPLFGDRDA